MKKPYQLGITVGRFQTFHKGHQMMLDKAVELCEKVGVLIGSSQESGTNKNPFTYEMRAGILRKIYGDSIHICPLPDIGVGNNPRWGEYVLATAKEQFGCMPDLLISGKEERRVDWFNSQKGSAVAELYIPKTIHISAAEMRELFVENRFDIWKNYCDERLWDGFAEMREKVLQSHENSETASM